MKVEIRTTEVKDYVTIPINNYSKINGIKCSFDSYDIITKKVSYQYEKFELLKKTRWFKTYLDANKSSDFKNITVYNSTYKKGAYTCPREYRIPTTTTISDKCTLFEWIRHELIKEKRSEAILEEKDNDD